MKAVAKALKPPRKRKAAAKEKPSYAAPALDKGLEILAFLAGLGERASIAEIARAIGRNKTEIYRMLLVLETRGYIARDAADGRFQVTERLFELGMSHAPKRALHDAALPVMSELSAKTLQSCHLGIVTNGDMIVVARVESPGPVSFSVKLGYRVPLLDSTSGRVIYAFQTAEWRAERVKNLRREHPSTKALRSLDADAAQIAKRGYAFEPSRLAAGIHDIGAPVIDMSGYAVASLTMPHMAHRLLAIDARAAIRYVVAAANDISRRLRSK